MEWKIEYWPETGVLYLKSGGTLEVESANALVKDLVQAAAAYRCTRHLVDHRATTFRFSLINYYQRPAINERLGISKNWKTAMVFAQSTDDTRFMETVFQNQGYNFRQFIDLEEALEWLVQD